MAGPFPSFIFGLEIFYSIVIEYTFVLKKWGETYSFEHINKSPHLPTIYKPSIRHSIITPESYVHYFI